MEDNAFEYIGPDDPEYLCSRCHSSASYLFRGLPGVRSLIVRIVTDLTVDEITDLIEDALTDVPEFLEVEVEGYIEGPDK